MVPLLNRLENPGPPLAAGLRGTTGRERRKRFGLSVTGWFTTVKTACFSGRNKPKDGECKSPAICYDSHHALVRD